MLQKPHVIGISSWTTSLALALKVRTRPVMPMMFGSREEPPRDSDKEEMDATEDDAKEKED